MPQTPNTPPTPAMPNTPDALAGALARYADLTTAALRRLFDGFAQPDDFYGMLRYHLGWVDERLEPITVARGGKGLRPSFLLLVNDALGGDEAAAAPLAAAVELLHNFSLVHDDIEDASTRRHHRPTVWSIWGVPLGLNAGDGLYAIAHLALFDSPLRTTAPERFIAIAHHFERTALCVCEGQHLDMTFERAADVSVDDYLRMIAGKSAALIAACAWIGACAAGATPEQAAAAERFGRELGLAFQMQDDILGIWGDEAVTGKSASSDIASRKKTLPVLLAMAHAEPRARERLRELYGQRDDAAGSHEIMAALDAVGARELTEEYLRHHRAAALQALCEIGLSAQAQEPLRQFADQFVNRSA